MNVKWIKLTYLKKLIFPSFPKPFPELSEDSSALLYFCYFILLQGLKYKASESLWLECWTSQKVIINILQERGVVLNWL